MSCVLYQENKAFSQVLDLKVINKCELSISVTVLVIKDCPGNQNYSNYVFQQFTVPGFSAINLQAFYANDPSAHWVSATAQYIVPGGQSPWVVTTTPTMFCVGNNWNWGNGSGGGMSGGGMSGNWYYPPNGWDVQLVFKC
ncbi:hypothetical protein DNU06_00015 [Putridiphycobacter roseus]|uniref:Uncharacterized protein n=1 Tax=Putridiphycobacter roseus TaxID=2219161 RepID=A0A2W1NFJ9_9FLAO|nr:hypothetical protein [Putridiphycobacter roseus]PZE18255.1 hypothetical protein DNU06_00015 [Putridiphycobacter roseus]